MTVINVLTKFTSFEDQDVAQSRGEAVIVKLLP